jgi:hypothetical protein
MGENIPNDHKLCQTAIKYTKWPQNIPNDHKIVKTFSIGKPFKVYPNWDFWFENKPSGNPACDMAMRARSDCFFAVMDDPPYEGSYMLVIIKANRADFDESGRHSLFNL